jgi:signal peptidase II
MFFEKIKKYIKIDGKGALISLFVTISTVIIDLVTKLVVMNTMTLGQSIPLIKNVLHITYITNKGAAFGSFSDARWLFMTLSSLLIVFLCVLLVTWEDRNTLFYVSVSMVLGGGIGNMIDRIFYGEVVDFIDFCAFPKLWQWIFNGADSFVCVGVGLLIIYYVRSEIRNAKEKE